MNLSPSSPTPNPAVLVQAEADEEKIILQRLSDCVTWLKRKGFVPRGTKQVILNLKSDRLETMDQIGWTGHG